jgi:hypothetical protein
MIARLSDSVRSVSTCGWSPPGSGGAPDRRPVAISSASHDTSRPSARVSLCPRDRCASTRAPSVSAIFCSPKNAGGPQRHPFLRRVARQVVLRQVGAIDRRRLVRAEQQDLTVVALAPQRLGGGFARRARADDGDGRSDELRRSVIGPPVRAPTLIRPSATATS